MCCLTVCVQSGKSFCVGDVLCVSLLLCHVLLLDVYFLFICVCNLAYVCLWEKGVLTPPPSNGRISSWPVNVHLHACYLSIHPLVSITARARRGQARPSGTHACSLLGRVDHFRYIHPWSRTPHRHSDGDGYLRIILFKSAGRRPLAFFSRSIGGLCAILGRFANI